MIMNTLANNNTLNIVMSDCSIKNINDVNIGDYLMNEKGIPAKVINTYIKEDTIYNITQTKGESYTIASSNNIILKASNYETITFDKTREAYRIRWVEKLTIKEKRFYLRDNNNSKEKTYEVAKKYLEETVIKFCDYTKYKDILKIKFIEYINSSKNSQLVYKGFCNYIPFEEKILPIDAYAFGYWLGDGTSANTEITTAETEIVDYFTKYSNELGLKFNVKGTNSKYHYYISSGRFGGPRSNVFLNFLKDYSLINNKHIPKIYKYNSLENRLKLLAGLIDSDGWKDKGCYDFVFKSEKLTDDIICLVRTLGFRANKKNSVRVCTNAKDGPKAGNYFRFSIIGNNLCDIPVLLDRKKIYSRETKKDGSFVGIKITEIGVKSVKFIELEDDSNILLQDFTIIGV